MGLILKDAQKIGVLPKGTELPKVPRWKPSRLYYPREWVGDNPLLIKYICSYLGIQNNP